MRPEVGCCLRSTLSTSEAGTRPPSPVRVAPAASCFPRSRRTLACCTLPEAAAGRHRHRRAHLCLLGLLSLSRSPEASERSVHVLARTERGFRSGRFQPARSRTAPGGAAARSALRAGSSLDRASIERTGTSPTRSAARTSGDGEHALAALVRGDEGARAERFHRHQASRDALPLPHSPCADRRRNGERHRQTLWDGGDREGDRQGQDVARGAPPSDRDPIPGRALRRGPRARSAG